MPQRNAFFDAQPARQRVRTNRGAALTCQKLPEPDTLRGSPREQPSQCSPMRSKTGLYVKNGGELKKLERCSAV